MPICKKCLREIKSLGWANHWAAHHREEQRRVDALIKAFNELYPVGSSVLFRAAISDGFKICTVKEPAKNHNGMAVVYFVERDFFCSIEPDFVAYPPFFMRKDKK